MSVYFYNLILVSLCRVILVLFVYAGLCPMSLSIVILGKCLSMVPCWCLFLNPYWCLFVVSYFCLFVLIAYSFLFLIICRSLLVVTCWCLFWSPDGKFFWRVLVSSVIPCGALFVVICWCIFLTLSRVLFPLMLLSLGVGVSWLLCWRFFVVLMLASL